MLGTGGHGSAPSLALTEPLKRIWFSCVHRTLGGTKTNSRFFFFSGEKYNPYWEWIQKHVLRATAAGTARGNNGREESWQEGEQEGSLQIIKGLPCGLKMQLVLCRSRGPRAMD